MSNDAPCRLFVYLAREAPIAVVLRRGPSDWTQLSLWHTDTDAIEAGQWLKGRVYERRCDVSAGGSLFAAFVRQSGAARPGQPKGADTWVAVSRPPYFTALALWFIGGTYHTGAFFPDRDSLWTGFQDAAPDIGEVPSWLKLTAPSNIPYVDRSQEWTDRTVHFNRLLRDGWQRLDDDVYRTKWQHRHPSRPQTLLMTQQFESFQEYGGPYVTEYELRDDTDRTTQSLGWASWAGWDQQGRLVLSQDGRLLAWSAAAGFSEIADLNDAAPDPQPSPAWAREWPPRPRG
jgi:hypothetical protein